MGSIIKLDDLLVDSLLIGRIITKKDVVFPSNPAIVQKALEKGIKLFEKIPQMSQVSKIDCPKDKEDSFPETGPLLEGAPGRNTILFSDGNEVAYMESYDVTGDTVTPTLSNKVASSDLSNEQSNTPIKEPSSSEKAIEAITRYEEKGYTVDTFVKEFIENETDTEVLNKINDAILLQLIPLTSSPQDITKQFIDKKKEVDDLKKQQNQMTKNIRQYEKNLEEHISKNHEASLVTSEKVKLTAAIKTLDQIKTKLYTAEKDLSDREHTKDNYITSPQIVQQLKEISSKIDKITRDTSATSKEQSDNESAKKIVQLITVDLKDQPEELNNFLIDNSETITNLTFSVSDALSMIKIIKSIKKHDTDYIEIIQALQKNISISNKK
jgi:hypothetical protein